MSSLIRIQAELGYGSGSRQKRFGSISRQKGTISSWIFKKKKFKLLISHALCVYINYHFSIHNHLNVSMVFAGSGPTFDTDPEHSTFRMDTMWARGRNREFFMIRALASSPHLI